jgi:chromosome segregation protein
LQAERELEANRRHAMHLLTLAGNARNHTAQARREPGGAGARGGAAEAEMARRGTSLRAWVCRAARRTLRFESAAERLKRLEDGDCDLREQLQAQVAAGERAARAANELRSEQAAAGRRDSLEALIKNHSYSTDTVRRLLKPGALAAAWRPPGTLADFLEVSGEHEGRGGRVPARRAELCRG